MFGITDEVCASFESWSQTQGASIVAILPLPVAVLAWANNTLATKDRDSLVVIATDQGAVGAGFKRRSLIYISQEETASDAFSVLERETDDLGLEDPVRYLWALNVPEERRTIPEDLVIIDEENIQRISGGSLALQEGHGKKIKHDRPLAHLLNWLVTQYETLPDFQGGSRPSSIPVSSGLPVSGIFALRFSVRATSLHRLDCL